MSRLSWSHANLVIGDVSVETVVQSFGVSLFDTIRLDTFEAGGMKEVLQFINDLLTTPQFGPVRLGIITQFERLSIEAQNALLKLLEEPPPTVQIVLFARTESTILATIKSRCPVKYFDEPAQLVDAELESNSLERFLLAEAQSKDENYRAVIERELTRVYTEWSLSGRSPKMVQRVEKLYDLYHNLGSNINKRILLEQFVLNE